MVRSFPAPHLLRSSIHEPLPLRRGALLAFVFTLAGSRRSGPGGARAAGSAIQAGPDPSARPASSGRWRPAGVCPHDRRGDPVLPGSGRPNPRDYVSCRILGEFHEKKAEETGDLACYERAEAGAPPLPRDRPDLRQGQGLARGRPVQPPQVRRRAGTGPIRAGEGPDQHRRPRDPGRRPARDRPLRRGREGVRRASQEGRRPAVLSRVASLLELKGDADEALKLMAEAEAKARKAGGDKGAAWFKARLGDIAFVAGRVDEAESHYRSVPPKTDPYHDATAALGRLRAGQGTARRGHRVLPEGRRHRPRPPHARRPGRPLRQGRPRGRGQAPVRPPRPDRRGKNEYLRASPCSTPTTTVTCPGPWNWPARTSSTARTSTVTTRSPGPCSRTTSPRKPRR